MLTEGKGIMGGSEPPDVGAKNQTPIPAKAVAALTHRVMASGPFKDLKTYLFFFYQPVLCVHILAHMCWSEDKL